MNLLNFLRHKNNLRMPSVRPTKVTGRFPWKPDVGVSPTRAKFRVCFFRSVLLFFLLAGWGGNGLSQTAAIKGQVKDPTGAAVYGAQVSCVDELGTSLTRRSDDQGRFRFEVSPGKNYEVVVSQPGFSAGTIQVARLESGETRDLNIVLQLSARSDSVVVTAALGDEPVAQLGNSVSILNEQDIRNAGNQLVADALRTVPGLTVSAAGRRGGTTSVFARGGNSNYNLVLLDGIKLNDFGGGLGFDFAHLVADNVSRIEVVRGPQSALYGSEAIGATVNVLTQRGEGPPRFFFQGEGGSYETRRWATGANGLTGRVDWALNLSRLDTEGANFNDNYRDQNASGRLGLGMTRSRAGFVFNFNANDAGAPGAYGRDPNQTFFGLDLTSRAKNNDYTYGTYFEHEFSSRFKQRFEGQFLSRNFRFLQTTGDSFSDNFRGTFRSESHVLLASNDSLAFGMEYQRERFFNNFITDVNGDVFALRRNNFAYFAENRWNWRQRLFVTAGVRLENFRTDSIRAVPFSHDQDFPSTSVVSTNPRISAAYFLRRSAASRAFNYAKLHGSFGTGIRAPNGFELAFTSNPELRPERARSFDAGVETSWWHGRSVVDFTYFFNHYQDQIVTLSGDLRRLSTFSSDNLGNSRAQGIELTLSLRPTSGIQFGGQYTFLDSEIRSLDGAPGRAQSIFKVGDELIRRPRHTGSFFATYTHRRVVVTMDANLRGSARDIDPNFGTFACDLGLPCIFRNPGFVNVNLGGSYELTEGITWYAHVNNLFNQKYEEVLGFPAFHLNFVSGIRLDFGGERGFRLKR